MSEYYLYLLNIINELEKENIKLKWYFENCLNCLSCKNYPKCDKRDRRK